MSWPAIQADEPGKARESLGRLKAGNDRYVKNASAPVSLSPITRQSLTKGLTPFATVLSCADSRVPPEYIFNTGLGELFVVRAAGEVINCAGSRSAGASPGQPRTSASP